MPPVTHRAALMSVVVKDTAAHSSEASLSRPVGKGEEIEGKCGAVVEGGIRVLGVKGALSVTPPTLGP